MVATRSSDKRSEFARLLRFTAVGLLNTAIDLGLFWLLRFLLGAPLLFANTLAYACAVSVGFWLNRHWTFADRDHQLRADHQYALFVALALGGMAISNTVVWSLARLLPELVSKCLSFVFIFAWNYTMSRLVVFRSRRRPP